MDSRLKNLENVKKKNNAIIQYMKVKTEVQ